MKVYRFPTLTSANRLILEAIVGHCLRLLKFPMPEEPFVKLDPKTMPWEDLRA
jgi:hypothetical protein